MPGPGVSRMIRSHIKINNHHKNMIINNEEKSEIAKSLLGSVGIALGSSPGG